MSRDNRYSKSGGWVCGPADTGATPGEMTIQEARRQALADLERAQQARREYAAASAAQWFGYKVD